MNNKILRFALLMVAAVALSSIASATVLCSSDIGNDVTTIPSCTVGTLSFSNFTVTLAGGSGTPQIDLAGVISSGGTYGLNFNPNLGSPSLVSDIHFTFDVTGPGIVAASLFNAGSGSSIEELVCTTQLDQTGFCSGTYLWNSGNVAGDEVTVSKTFAAQSSISVWKDISISNPQTSHLTSFNQSFTVPEPMTMSLMGVGLLGLGFLGRRLRK